MRKGWFEIPGVQQGDRTIKEQLQGLAPALAEVKGKRVLDLGCAEGGIAREFARFGAVEVVGIELLADHLNAARKMCKGLPVKFIQSELAAWIKDHPDPEQFDVVLALSVAHKLHEPGWLLEFAARSARELVLFRGPGKAGMYWDGWLKAKFGDGKCHVPTIMQGHGFVDEKTLDSARGERVQYWRRG